MFQYKASIHIVVLNKNEFSNSYSIESGLSFESLLNLQSK